MKKFIFIILVTFNYFNSVFAENNNFNHIFAQVRGRGDAYYNSNIVPKSHLVDIDFDPLNYLIHNNINKNIKIHAWINIYYLWSSKFFPKQKNHLFFKYKSLTYKEERCLKSS